MKKQRPEQPQASRITPTAMRGRAKDRDSLVMLNGLRVAILPLHLASWFVLGSVGLIACGDDSTLAGPPAPAPQKPAPPGWPVPEGRYEIVTDMALPGTVLASAGVASFFDDLRATRDDPAGTWFTLLKHAGFPQAEKLLKALPSVLADRLYGWINETLAAQFQPGQAKRAELDGIIDEASALLARFDVLTTLNVPAAEMGTPASHTFAGFGFKLLELNVTVPVPRFVVNRQGPFVLETLTGVTFTQATEPALVFSDHAFGLPWGEYAWAAINIRQRQRGGIDLRSHIGRLFDCPGFAADVAANCLGFVCVGHKSELQEICEKGLDQVVESIRRRIVAVNFDALRFASGSARGVDLDGEGAELRIDAILDGRWDASVDVGQGPRAVEAVFLGHR